jgi:hypothetical protein
MQRKRKLCVSTMRRDECRAASCATFVREHGYSLATTIFASSFEPQSCESDYGAGNLQARVVLRHMPGAVMTDALNVARHRFALAMLVFVAATVMPARSSAEMPSSISLIDYGFRGFTLGTEIGLAVGFLATGPVYEHDEWRTLVIGMGIGALSGMTTGFLLAVADSTGRYNTVPAGYYILRDASYGTLIGAAVGAVVGMLILVDDGTTKDILTGAAYGTLFGAIAGIAYGIIDARNSNPIDRRVTPEWRVSAAPMITPYGMGVGASLKGTF